jgi:YD repeat-containing protein
VYDAFGHVVDKIEEAGRDCRVEYVKYLKDGNLEF